MSTPDDSTESTTDPSTREMVGPDSSAAPTSAPKRRRFGKGNGSPVRTVGEVLITLGVVVLLFVFYELYVTNWLFADKQRTASASLDDQWAHQRQTHPELIDGKSFARLYVPSFGADYSFPIQHGVSEESLELGPGHYKGTQRPGEPGNVGIAGHRVGKGAPFNDLDRLRSCDSILVETATDFFVYRVLPMADEVPAWAAGKANQPRCAGVPTLHDPAAPGGGPYADTYGRKIVKPDRGDAVAPVPYREDAGLPIASRAALLTLTTCHPQFSDRERLVVHAVLTKIGRAYV